ncbi:MAG TPA: PASTA domain-containing protein [Gemmatimonadota bacterium]|nr:PASTA domain-containing protein [Gemmatimonadota bacterium]
MSYRRRRGLGGRGRAGTEDDRTAEETSDRTASSRGEAGASHPGRRRALISAGAVVGALVVGYALAALWLFPSAASAGDASIVRVPDVVGLSEAEARAAAVDVGLDFRVGGGMSHREAPEGTVLSQRPLPGQFARPGAPVEAMLSRGPEVHTLPDVAGLSERQAEIVLERLGFDVDVESREDPIPAGRAIETRPPAGSELAVPGRLVLVVSEGAPIVEVPDMRGLHIDDAVRILADAGLELGSLSFDPGAVEAPGRIVGQYPPEGYSLRAGDGVELRVAGDRGSIEADGEEPLL